MDFKNLTYDRFKELAKDKNLSTHEKVGFPDEYRDGTEELILKDILSKCQSLSIRGGITLELSLIHI